MSKGDTALALNSTTNNFCKTIPQQTLRQKQFDDNNFSSTREDAPSGEGLSTTKPWESLALHQVEVFVAIHMIGLAAGGLSIGLVGGLASKIGLAV